MEEVVVMALVLVGQDLVVGQDFVAYIIYINSIK